MNTFLPYPSFEKSAQCLDYKRLGKQRVEAWQIYNVLKKGEYSICPKCNGKGILWEQTPFNGHYSDVNRCKKCKGAGKVKTAWYNHPCVRMWKGYELALLCYGLAISNEWKERKYKDTIYDRFLNEILKITESQVTEIKHYIFYNSLINNIEKPKWLGNKKFHSARRSNLLRKDKKYYSKFGWKEPNNLTYIWGGK